MRVCPTELPEVLIVEPRVFGDDRGYLFESFHAQRYGDHGIGPFVQDNQSFSTRGVLRGMHYQLTHAQGKLLGVAQGTVFDVAVDIRRGSPRFGRWVGVELSAENHKQLYVPPGFAHGFLVTSETAVLCYKCTDFYTPGDEHGIRWDDPAVGIAWPDVGPYELSARDTANPRLAEAEHLPVYEPPR